MRMTGMRIGTFLVAAAPRPAPAHSIALALRRSLHSVLATLFVTGAALSAQDREFIAALERAQQERPANLTSVSRIAPESEPGAPLVIHGHAVAENGTTPVAGAIVFAYHTDREGLYDRPGKTPHSWRLKGWAKTDAQGRFEFRTIRPGAYPNNKIPQHVHLQIFMPDGRRYWADELHFADDPLVPAAERKAASEVRSENGVQHVDFTFRLKAANKF
jgi:protocatechuate 3,4-dioxygenase beta subunit